MKRRNKKPLKLYLICSADYLETAFFCGDARECTEVLGLSDRGCFFSAVSKGSKVMHFFRIEKVDLQE